MLPSRQLEATAAASIFSCHWTWPHPFLPTIIRRLKEKHHSLYNHYKGEKWQQRPKGFLLWVTSMFISAVIFFGILMWEPMNADSLFKPASSGQLLAGVQLQFCAPKSCQLVNGSLQSFQNSFINTNVIVVRKKWYFHGKLISEWTIGLLFNCMKALWGAGTDMSYALKRISSFGCHTWTTMLHCHDTLACTRTENGHLLGTPFELLFNPNALSCHWLVD